MRVAIDGLSHQHHRYLLAELEARPTELELVGIRLDGQDDHAVLTEYPECQVFHDTVELIENTRPDAIFNCGIYRNRAKSIALALQRGIHVLADKPIAITPAGFEQIAYAARQSSAVLSMAFEKRWYPVTQNTLNQINDGRLGTIRTIQATGPHLLRPAGRPAWYFDGGYGDVLTDLPIHDIDLSLLFTQARQGTIQAWRITRDGFGTACAVNLTLDGQAQASIDANWLWPDADCGFGKYQMRLTGDDGVAYLDFSEPEPIVFSNRQESAAGLAVAKRPCEEFFDSLLLGRMPEVDAEDCLRASYLSLLAQRSADLGGRLLEWDFDCDEAFLSRHFPPN